jgi:hypothetical protein
MNTLETIQRRLDRLEFIYVTAQQISMETGRDVTPALIRFAAKRVMKWNRKRVSMGLKEYW